MNYIQYNIEKKLNKSIFSSKNFINDEKKDCALIFNYDSKKQKISFVIKKLLFKFLIFFSRNLINKKKNIKNLILFLKIYWYYTTFFFDNKLFFYKKYFLKKNYNIPYLRKFFLDTKQVRLKPCLHRLKSKKISFYKKNIWTKNKKFRKKNLLIFNKKFFKNYTSTRFNNFFVDSIAPFFKIKKVKSTRFLRKKLFGLLHKRYYYLFLHKRYTFNLSKKRRNKLYKKIISYNLKYKTYSKIFVNRKLFAHRRRRRWRRVYYIRKKRRIFLRSLLLGFDNKVLYGGYTLDVLKKYLDEYSQKLANKYVRDKNFLKRFFLRRTFPKRCKNIKYFLKWKHKEFFFHSVCFFKKNKNLKKILFSSIWLKFFVNKIFWRKRRNFRKFLLYYYNNFFFNKSFFLFNSLLKARFCFTKAKRWKKRTRFKRRRFTIYIKRIRRRVIRLRIKRRFAKFFLILLFFRLMKKHIKASRTFLFKNALFLSTFKKIRLNLISSILLGNDLLYFKNHSFLNYNAIFLKKNLKIISLLKKK